MSEIKDTCCAEREPKMKIHTFNKNSMGQNIYLCHCEETNEGILIDAGCNTADENAIMALIHENSIIIKAILLTHGHYDHITAAARLKSLTNAEIYSHVSEKQLLENPELNLSCLIRREISVTPDKLLNDGDVFHFGNISLKVLHTPGHTPGGVCYYYKKTAVPLSEGSESGIQSCCSGGVYTDEVGDAKHRAPRPVSVAYERAWGRAPLDSSLFSGDTLFKGSIGRTDFPLSDHDKMMRNISAKLLTLPDETVVYPGHGDSTSIGREKKSNPFLR